MRELRGICPAIVTPFDANDHFDPAAMRKLVRFQLSAGVDGFYVCGSTGEGLLQTADERRAVLETVLDEVAGRATVIAHVGAFRLDETLELARHASVVGADAISSLPPAYFYKPDMLTLIHYYEIVASATDLPFLVYNLPQRTGITMTSELFDRLLELPNVVGMKDSSGNTFQIGLYFSEGRKPIIFNGEDPVLLHGLMVGACGGIGSTYNVMPQLYVKLWRAFQTGDVASAVQTQLRMNEVIRVLLTVNHIAAIKQTLSWMGMDAGEPRMPNRALTSEEAAKLKGSLDSLSFFDEGA